MKTNLLYMLALIKPKSKGRKCLIFLVSLFSMLLAPQHALALDAIYTIDNVVYRVYNDDPNDLSVALNQLIGDIPSSPSGSYEFTDGDTKLFDNGILYVPDYVWLDSDHKAKVVIVGDGDAFDTWSSEDCTNVEKVILGNQVVRIGSSFFRRNKHIKSVTISASVYDIANTFLVYNEDMPLEEFEVDGNSNYFVAENGILFNKNKTELVSVPCASPITNLNSTYLPNSINKIRLNAISQNKNITSITIPENCKEIEHDEIFSFYAYSGNLETITVASGNSYFKILKEGDDGPQFLTTANGETLIRYAPAQEYNSCTLPESVKYVAPCAFHYCAKLLSVNLGNAVTLGDFAFYGCWNMNSIFMPASLTTIGGNCFQECVRLSTVSVESGSDYFSSNDGVLFSADKKTLQLYPAGREGDSYEIPYGTETVAVGAFWGAKMKTLSIRETLKTVKETAFRECKNLTTVNFSSPSSIETLEKKSFWYCEGLQEINLPASVKVIGDECFSGCTSLKTVTIADGSQLESLGSNLCLANNGALTEFSIPTSCTSNSIQIQPYAFCDQNNLEAINIPASVTNIGAHAFENCTKLGTGTITFKNNTANAAHLTIDNSAFANIAKNSLTLPVQTDSIGIDAFKGWTMTEVTLPAKTTKLSPQAFKLCAKLANIWVNNNNPRFASLGGYLCTKDLSTLYIFPIGKASNGFALMPPSLTAIGDHSLYEGGENLTKVCIPKKVNTLGARAFGLSSGIKEIAFLCDELIDPENNIVQGVNLSSFDDGVANEDGKDYRNDIKIYLRKKVYVDYMAKHNNKANDKYYEFYKNFNAIECIPTIAHVGDSITTNNDVNYGDEYFVMGDGKAMLLSTTADVETFVVPEKVTVGGAQHTVGIGDYAFENANPNINEVVVKGDVGYVGAMAFMTTEATRTAENKMKPGSTSSGIKQVVFTATTPMDIATNHFNLSDDFNEFTTASGFAQNIYVKKNSLTNNSNLDDSEKNNYYNTAGGWSAFANQMDYRIPGINISHRYGTLSREFDVDLADCTNRVVYAFVTPTDGVQPGPGDYGDTKYHVQMHSINEGGEGDGTYIPAGTGVLLCTYDKNDPLSNDPNDENYFFYTIGEKDVNVATESVMKPITVNPKHVINSNKDIYVMGADGVFWLLPNSDVTIPIHKSYLQIPGANGAKVVFSLYMPDGDVTTIDSTSLFDETPAAVSTVYDLQGRKLSTEYGLKRGMYIVNGKKVIVK